MAGRRSASAVSRVLCGLVCCALDRRQPSEYGLWPVTGQWARECNTEFVVGATLIVGTVGAGLVVEAVDTLSVSTVHPESTFVSTTSGESGPPFVLGGAYGLEASLLGSAALLVGVVFVGWYGQNPRKRIREGVRST